MSIGLLNEESAASSLSCPGEDAHSNLLSHLTQSAVRYGNVAEPLQDCEEIFDAMREAMRSARRQILFLSYIFEKGREADRFSELLIERASEGVEVYVLLDRFGSHKIPLRIKRKLEKSQIKLQWFRPFKFNIFAQLQNRLHRKLLVVDQELGFTGGIGIGFEWEKKGDMPPWRDLHFRIKGPIVADLTEGFWESWHTGGGQLSERTSPQAYLMEPQGHAQMSCVQSLPGMGKPKIKLLFHRLLECAAQHIRIGTAYFNPSTALANALIATAQRGVKIEIIMPGRYVDNRVSQWASAHHVERLLQAGIRFYRFGSRMYHVKLWRVDGDLTVIGSANLNQRSIMKDQELCVVIRDQAFAQQMDDIWVRDRDDCSELTLKLWRRRPLSRRIVERLSYFIRSHV